jgi:hypothetical protein
LGFRGKERDEVTQKELFLTEERGSGATFSADRRYRYVLWRTFGEGPAVAYVLLNPSTADETQNDPTVERCVRRGLAMGYARVLVTNIFALRSTDPEELYRAEDSVGPENDGAILQAARSAELVVCGWGNHGEHRGRGREVLELLHEAGIAPHCLTITRSGQPGHPLYVGYNVQPRRWKYGQ